MASLRAHSGARRVTIQRSAKMCGLSQSSPATVMLPGAMLLSCLNTSIQTQARYTSVLRVTAFEQAMQELYGNTWKNQLNNRQRSYVSFHEHIRQVRSAGVEGGKAQNKKRRDAAEADERKPQWEWRKKVEEKKMEIRWQKKMLSSGPFRF